MTSSFILERASHLLYPRKQNSLSVFYSLPAFSGTYTQASHSCFQHHPIQEERSGIHYLPWRLGWKVRQDWGVRRPRQTTVENMSAPHPRSPCKEITLCTIPIHKTVDAGFSLFLFPLFLWKLVFYLSWDLYFNPEVIPLLSPNTTGNNWI